MDVLPSDPNKAILKHLHLNTLRLKLEFEDVFRFTFDSVREFYNSYSEDRVGDVQAVKNSAEKIFDLSLELKNYPYLVLDYQLDGYYLFNHVVKSAFYTLLIANSLDYSKSRLIDLIFGALLADVGMSKIPNSILEKPSPLTEEEYSQVRTHTISGYQFLTKTCKLKHNQCILALQHHENYDGTGYPSKIRKNEIEETVCIFSIADNFTAMIGDRPWRKRFLPYDAMKSMISVTMNKFDLNILKLFLNKISIYPIGSYVELSDGSIAKILDSNNGKMLRPSIHLVENMENLPEEGYFNLSLETNLTITKAVNLQT